MSKAQWGHGYHSGIKNIIDTLDRALSTEGFCIKEIATTPEWIEIPHLPLMLCFVANRELYKKYRGLFSIRDIESEIGKRICINLEKAYKAKDDTEDHFIASLNDEYVTKLIKDKVCGNNKEKYVYNAVMELRKKALNRTLDKIRERREAIRALGDKATDADAREFLNLVYDQIYTESLLLSDKP